MGQVKEPSEMTDQELSEAVATDVMGWYENTVSSGDGGTPTMRWFRKDWVLPSRGYPAPPPYATDIVAAMGVFEKVAGGGKGARIEGIPVGSRVLYTAHVPLPETYIIEAANMISLPRAICEAALLWARSRKDG